MQIKETTIEILEKSGWHRKRKNDITGLVYLYEKKGFEMFPAAKKFLEEYGMLDVCYPVNQNIPEEDMIKYGFKRHRVCTTNKISGLNGTLSRDYVEEYEEEYVEEKLVVVGSIAGHETLMISESGRLFSEYGFWGNNAEEFWDRLLNHGIILQWSQWEDF